MYEVSGNIEQSNKYLMESFKLNNNNYAMLAKLIENDVLDEKELNYNFFDENLKKVSDISILVDTMKDGSTKNFFLF